MNTKRLFLSFFVLASLSTNVHAQVSSVDRLSVDASGIQGEGSSTCVAISDDGRYVAFTSSAENLVPGDQNGVVDVFVKDRETGAIEIVSVGAGNTPSNGESGLSSNGDCALSISGDARYVVFASASTAFHDGDLNGFRDVFYYDRTLDFVHRVSIDINGGDPNAESHHPRISRDGRFIVFDSTASNYLTFDPDGHRDIFLYNMQFDSVTGASPLGTELDGDSSNPDISADASYVVYSSMASNLVTGDNNQVSDIFLQQLSTSGPPTASPVRLSINADKAEGNGDSILPVISGDGATVAFASTADNLVSGDSNKLQDVFSVNVSTGAVTLESLGQNGKSGKGGNSSRPSISATGRYIAFVSAATNLVPNDTNNVIDLFLRDRQTSTTTRVSLTNESRQLSAPSDSESAIFADDNRIFFSSTDDGVVTGDTNNLPDVFVARFQRIATTDIVLEEAPEVTVDTDRTVTFLLEKFAGAKRTTASTFPARFAVGDPAFGRSGKRRFVYRYELTIQTVGTSAARRSDLRRIISKRNKISVRNLSAGSYTASYKLRILNTKGKLLGKTASSPSASFTVS